MAEFVPLTLKRLSLLKSGSKGIVAELDTKDRSILRKLMSMGILPGVEIEVKRTFPTYIFQAGFTQVAVDRDIASVVLVETI